MVKTNERETLKIPEVAKILGIGESATYAAVKKGEIPSIRIGRRVLVPRALLDEFLGRSA